MSQGPNELGRLTSSHSLVAFLSNRLGDQYVPQAVLLCIDYYMRDTLRIINFTVEMREKKIYISCFDEVWKKISIKPKGSSLQEYVRERLGYDYEIHFGSRP
jgi:hypothetical protein